LLGNRFFQAFKAFISKLYFELYNKFKIVSDIKIEKMKIISKPAIALKIGYTITVVSILIGAIVIAYILKGKLHLFSIGIA
jgi:hypothetical protein